MSKSKTVKVGSTKIKGATAADKKVIDAAKASVNAERSTTAADETPEAQRSTTAKKAAAEKQFAKADKAGAPTADEIRVGLAARGY